MLVPALLMGPTIAADGVGPLTPFKVVSEEGDPEPPGGLGAQRTVTGWSLYWDAVLPADDGAIGYDVHVWQPGTGWTSSATNATATSLEAFDYGGLITVTTHASHANGTTHHSAAGEMLVISQIGSSCPPVRVWLQPPPPGAGVDIECIN